jgi:radical SAM protein with 4Fe4S-binding SPASM domain
MEPVGGRFQRLAAVADQRHIPLNVTIEISLSCNLRCVHCYNFDRDHSHHPDRSREEALTGGEIHRVIDEIRGEGALFIAFTGGEPTAHPSVGEFVGHAARSGMFTRLKTNGTRLNASLVARLAAAGLQAVDISVYGASAETHDTFVRVPGSLEQTLAGCRRARDAGIAVSLSFVLSRANAAEADEMRALADSLGVHYSLDPHLTRRHDGSGLPPELALDGPTIERLYRGPLKPYIEGGRPGEVRIACPCARSNCGIGCSGEVYPCIGAPLPAGNVRRQSFGEIWRTSPVLNWIRGLRNEDFATCSSCEHVRYCRRNSGVMLNNTGDFTGPPNYGDDLCCTEAAIIHSLVKW